MEPHHAAAGCGYATKTTVAEAMKRCTRVSWATLGMGTQRHRRAGTISDSKTSSTHQTLSWDGERSLIYKISNEQVSLHFKHF